VEPDAPDAPARRSPLDDRHRALGAKLVPFGGWDMPLHYGSVIEEHRACRGGAVVFDVSHLGTVRVEGPGALDALQASFTNDLRRIGPGRAQYTHLLDPADAHVVDDIIVWWLDADRFDVMPNASNTGGVRDALAEVAARPGEPLLVTDVTAGRAILAVQGPAARERLSTIAPEAAAVGRFAVERVEVVGVPVTVAGTGYTGEDGVELAVPARAAGSVWDALLAAGVTPAGLGARDTLRLEAGLPLHGHELGTGITPLQAGLGWVVRWTDDRPFRGRDALAAERDAGPARVLRGLVATERGVPRDGQAVLVGDRPVGIVTSGNHSPTLGVGIALALVEPGIEVGDHVEIDVRGRRLPADVVATPFVRRS
jgi:aminomethyltransferase